MSLVSIIIPTYNRAHLIGETLDSILAQTFQNWECIVVDDGSIDNTEKLIDKYIQKDNRFKFLKRPDNLKKGPNSCRNYGFENSKGAYINFFDSDDLYKPHALESWLQKFSDTADAVVSQIEFIKTVGTTPIKENQIVSDNLVGDHFLGKISFYVCGPLWRRKFLEEQKFLFNDNLRNGDDWDFNMRMLYKQPSLIFMDKALVQNRVHDSSLSKERNNLNKEELISYFSALDHHLKKVTNSDKGNSDIFTHYVLRKYNLYLRHSLKYKNHLSFFLLKKLLIKELQFHYYKAFTRTILGYISFVLFGKGLQFLKF